MNFGTANCMVQFVFQHFKLNACKLSDHLSTASSPSKLSVSREMRTFLQASQASSGVSIVKKATFLMTITQCESNNSLTPEFKWTSFEKRNNLDEPINIKTKAEERSVIQISFRTQDPNIRPAQSGLRVKNYSWSIIHCVFKIRQSARFTTKIHNLCAF